MPSNPKKIRSASEIFQRISAMESQIGDKVFISLLYGSYGVGKPLLGLAIAQYLKSLRGGRILFLDSSDGVVSVVVLLVTVTVGAAVSIVTVKLALRADSLPAVSIALTL